MPKRKKWMILSADARASLLMPFSADGVAIKICAGKALKKRIRVIGKKHKEFRDISACAHVCSAR
jgi:hypothetical protein